MYMVRIFNYISLCLSAPIATTGSSQSDSSSPIGIIGMVSPKLSIPQGRSKHLKGGQANFDRLRAKHDVPGWSGGPPPGFLGEN